MKKELKLGKIHGRRTHRLYNFTQDEEERLKHYVANFEKIVYKDLEKVYFDK